MHRKRGLYSIRSERLRGTPRLLERARRPRQNQPRKLRRRRRGAGRSPSAEPVRILHAPHAPRFPTQCLEESLRPSLSAHQTCLPWGFPWGPKLGPLVHSSCVIVARTAVHASHDFVQVVGALATKKWTTKEKISRFFTIRYSRSSWLQVISRVPDRCNVPHRRRLMTWRRVEKPRYSVEARPLVPSPVL